MFRHLRTKLTVLYAGLFAAILVLIAVLALAEVSNDAQLTARKELATSSRVFERVWAQRDAQLETDTVLLARDFGFRSAVATQDVPTIRSALDNLKTRLGVARAMMISANGSVVSATGVTTQLDAPTLHSLQGDDVVSGVLVLGGKPYEAVSTPISPGLNAGWVVFAETLDYRQMGALQSMAAIPLTASIAYQARTGRWLDIGGPVGPDLAAFLDAATSQPRSPPVTLKGREGTAVAVATPLGAVTPGRPAVLVLQYPMAKVLAPYRLLLGLMVGTGLIGFAALVAGTWVLARSVTKPISSLEEAAKRLQRGERARVEVQTQDEIGRLAESFNTMAAEIIQREHELETARDLAEAANRAKSSFLANMSHEVRTPLNGVIGVAGVLSSSRLDPDQKQMVGIIQNSASVLQRVLDDVLDLARVEAGRMEIIEDDFDLGEVMRALSDGAAVQCQTKGLAFELAMDEATETMVTGDRVRLEQILGNLLSNAVKFTERGGVSLAVTAGEAGFRFEVRDTGIGFEPDTAAQLFQPFQQADGSITRKYGGTGLGLSISRELARAMGGELSATGAPGKGASFVLALPFAPAERRPTGVPTAEPAGAAPELAEGVASARVLVADDHETNRTVARMILEGVGVEVVCVEDGAQAVAAFQGGGFDLVFMDMQMPVMDGLSAIRSIREGERTSQRARTPILMLSANALPEHVAAAYAAGADGHVAKPITPPRLIAAVGEALSHADAEADERIAV